MADPITLSAVGVYTVGLVNNVFQNCVGAHVDRYTTGLFGRHNNQDIQKALEKSWKATCDQLEQSYRKPPHSEKFTDDDRENIRTWLPQLTRKGTMGELFPEIRTNDIDVADLRTTSSAVDAWLTETIGWEVLPTSFRSTIRTHLLDGLLFNFIEIGIKGDSKASIAAVFQQLTEIRRVTANIDTFWDEFKNNLQNLSQYQQYQKEIINLLHSIKETGEETKTIVKGNTDTLADVSSTVKRIEQRQVENLSSLALNAVLQPKIQQPASHFVGRQQEIADIVEALQTAPNTHPAVVAIRGMGGLGKTQLAYAVVQEVSKTFDGPQFLIELQGSRETPRDPQTALRELITNIDRTIQLPDDLPALKRIYLAMLTGKRAIIVADDARDADQLEPLLPPAGCALVITSRNHFMLENADLTPFDPTVLAQSEAETLLQTMCPPIGTDAPRLAQLCGRLPLALRISAGLLKSNKARQVADYIRDLDDERQRLRHLRDPFNTSLDVAASLNLSYQSLTPQLQIVLRQLSVFPASFDQDAAEAVVDVDAELEDDMLDLLRIRSLIEQDAMTQRYSLHDLVRVFASGKLQVQDISAAKMRHVQWYVRVADAADIIYHRGKENTLIGLALFDTERTNIDTSWA